MVIIDLINKKFGRLTVISKSKETNAGQIMWDCLCDCGNRVAVTGRNLRYGKTKSCGCLKRTVNLKHGATVHGKSTPEYNAWRGMKSRCYNKNLSSFKHYGGRGITVCERWKRSFADFYSDMGRRPSDGYSIDRIDNDLGYCPENCRWATKAEQSNNTRSVKKISHKGKELSQSQWSVSLNGSQPLVGLRLKNGWDKSKAVSTKAAQKEHKITYNGETRSLSEWSKKIGGNTYLVGHRIRSGWSIKKAITTPPPATKKITYNKETLSTEQWSKRIGGRPGLVKHRLKNGWDEVSAITTPPDYKQKLITHNGETLNLSQWSEKLGGCRGLVKGRIKRGWPEQMAVSIAPSMRKEV